MNRHGHAASLTAAHPGNQSRLVHGVYSRHRELLPEAAEVADAIMGLPHTVPADRIGAERVGMLLVQIGRVEAALADGRVEGKRGGARELVDVHRRLHAELREWLDRFGLTPRGRAEWVKTLAGGGLGERIRQAVEEGRNGS